MHRLHDLHPLARREHRLGVLGDDYERIAITQVFMAVGAISLGRRLLSGEKKLEEMLDGVVLGVLFSSLLSHSEKK